MDTLKKLIILGALFFSFTAQSQCGYDTLSLQITHINCHDVPTGEIDLFIPNSNASVSWIGPPHWNTNIPFSSTSIPITGLYEGDYIITISEYGSSGDTICQRSDTFTVNQTNDITATYLVEDICSEEDSADLIIIVTGGTPYNNGELYQYELIDNTTSLIVGTNDTVLNLPPGEYSLNVVDKNGCTPKHPEDLDFEIDSVVMMNPFMSSVGVICKDDNRGEARVFVQQGTPPFTFDWGAGIEPIEHDSFSVIMNLFPGTYSVTITDQSGCMITDSIDVESNPKICLTIYKAFSPNYDEVNQFWQIENIELYPQALVTVYDRNGREVFRRRNYINTENVAFGGHDSNDQPLPSGTYYYIIALENGDDVFRGTLTIMR